MQKISETCITEVGARFEPLL